MEAGRCRGQRAAAITRNSKAGPGHSLWAWKPLTLPSVLALSRSRSEGWLTSPPLCLVVRPFVGERPCPGRRRTRFRGDGGGGDGGVARARKPHALWLRAVPSQPLLPERNPSVALLRSHYRNFGVGGIRIPRGQSPGRGGKNEREECWARGESSRAMHSRHTSRRCLVLSRWPLTSLSLSSLSPGLRLGLGCGKWWETKTSK